MKLTTAQRNALPSSDFVFPQMRKYPVNDPNHARSALSRVSEYGTPAEQEAVRAKVHSKYPEIQPRWMGGSVKAGKPYLVGDDQGKVVPGISEVFVPNQDGTIIPNKDLAPVADDNGDSYPVYPNGIPKRAMDERLPNGKTMAESIDPTMGTGIVVPSMGAGQPSGFQYQGRSLPTNYDDGPDSEPDSDPDDAPKPWSIDQEMAASRGMNAGTTSIGPVAPSMGYDSLLDQKKAKLADLENNGVPKHGFWKRLADNALMGFARGGIGGAIAGAAIGGVSPRLDQKARKDIEEANLNGEIGVLEKQRAADTANQNIIDDNNRANQQLKALQDYRDEQNRIKEEGLTDKRAKDQMHQQSIDRQRFMKMYPYFDPTKATDAQKNALAKFGETPDSMGAYDYSKPNFKQSGGVTFKYNPNSGAWEDSGLPQDKSKAIVDIQVTDPNTGVTSTYSTTNEKAAALKTSLERQGMSIQAAQERQNRQQNFQAGENQKNRDFRTQFQSDAQQYGADQARQRAINGFKRAYFNKNGKNPSQGEIDAYVNNQISPLLNQ